MIIRQFFSFAAVGVVGTAAHYSTLIALVQIMHVNPVVSSGAGFVVGALVNYALNYRLTFRSTKLHRDSMPKFFLVALFGLGFNTAIMALMTEVWKLHYLVAQVLATAGVLVWNFAVNRYWTFK
jgi:putative flippase GtrA